MGVRPSRVPSYLLVLLIGALGLSAAPPPPGFAEPSAAAAGPAERTIREDPGSARDDRESLPSDWRSSPDLLWTVEGDRTGLHLMSASADSAYTWRTVATLSEPGHETDRWIGNACLTESGERAVVSYAPRAFTNHGGLFLRGAFTAVVDMDTGAVTKLPVRATLAYYSPGCGEGELAVLSQMRSPEEASGPAVTRLFVVDTAGGTVRRPVEMPGQVTSAVPTESGIVAASGTHLVAVRQGGEVATLAEVGSVPFGLAVDRSGAVIYSEGGSGSSRLMRITSTTVPSAPQVLASSSAGWVVARRGVDGRVFVLGRPDHVGPLPGGVELLDLDIDARPSSHGQTALVGTIRPPMGIGEATLPSEAWVKSMTTASGLSPDDATPLDLRATVLENGSLLRFRVVPGIRASRELGSGSAAGPLTRLAGGRAAITTAQPSSAAVAVGTAEPTATCSVPRNDPATQVYQPTARQVEWAADQAVVDNLRTSRPDNWKQSGLTSWAPQGMFPSQALEGGGRVPVQVLLGILAQESNLWQASGHAMPGVTGNPLVGNYYGRDVYDDDSSNDWDIDFTEADCGYGVGQVTDGMRQASAARPGETTLPERQQRAIALDYATNISRSLQILQDKWNQTRRAGLVHSNGDPKWIENWVFAVWAYNSGFHPDKGDGSPWGVGWLNNPANPIYNPTRQMFNKNPSDPAIPQEWPYQEKVLGWAAYSIATPDGPGFRPAWWISTEDRDRAQAPYDTFCTAANDCHMGESYQPNAPEVAGAPPGPCAHQNASGQYDLKCWHHTPVEYNWCAQGYCGNELLRFNTTYPEQPDGTYYPPVCTTAGLPSGALIVDDVPENVRSPRPSCGHPWVESGSFSLSVASDSAKVDLHQIGAGMGGHFWFAHTRTSDAVGGRLKVTGTWQFSTAFVNQWGRVLVHMPDHGAHTQQAAYRISTAPGVTKTRYALQRTRQNKWVSLGVMRFNGFPSISLSTETFDGTGSDDVAWDAVAIQPLSAKPRQFVVALGDSYSSGEGASDPAGGDDYYVETDNNGHLADDEGRNACHRSPFAWSRKATLADSTATIGSRADSWDPQLDYQFHACSGAQTENLLPYHSVPAGQPKPENLFGQAGRGQYGEMSQLDKGYLDANTTLVTVSIGGNDARFSDVVQECLFKAGLYECQNAKLPGETEEASVTVPREIHGRVRRSIEVMVYEIAKRAPNAQIVLMGYPKLIENPGDCMSAVLSQNEAEWLNSMGDEMSTMLESLVGGLRLAGYKVTYANPIADFAGKAICGNPESVHGVVMNLTEGDEGPPLPSAQSFHPNLNGTTLYANALDRALRSLGL